MLLCIEYVYLVYSGLSNGMDPEQQKQKYELAYHLMPELESDTLKAGMVNIESLIAQNGGTIVVSREPRKVRLSYPIKHRRFANFGTLDFDATPETIANFQSQLKLQDCVLRYIILSKSKETEIRTLADRRLRKGRPQTSEIQVKPEEILTPEQVAAKEEKLKAEIEDVLGKI